MAVLLWHSSCLEGGYPTVRRGELEDEDTQDGSNWTCRIRRRCAVRGPGGGHIHLDRDFGRGHRRPGRPRKRLRHSVASFGAAGGELPAPSPRLEPRHHACHRTERPGSSRNRPFRDRLAPSATAAASRLVTIRRFRDEARSPVAGQVAPAPLDENDHPVLELHEIKKVDEEPQ